MAAGASRHPPSRIRELSGGRPDAPARDSIGQKRGEPAQDGEQARVSAEKGRIHMTIRLVLEIDEPTPSRNRTHGAHWSRNHAMRKRWAWLVRGALCEARRAAERGDPLLTLGLWPLKHATVRVVRHGPRLLDPEHATAGLKWLPDQLVTERVLTDDKPAHLTLAPVEQYLSKPYRTIVVVES